MNPGGLGRKDTKCRALWTREGAAGDTPGASGCAGKRSRAALESTCGLRAQANEGEGQDAQISGQSVDEKARGGLL